MNCSSMLLRLVKILVAIFLSLMFTISLLKLVICVYNEYVNEDDLGSFSGSSNTEVDEWLEENDLGEYKKLFRDNGEFI